MPATKCYIQLQYHQISKVANLFFQSRVPLKNLFDYIKAGHSLNDFLEDFPSVKKEHAIQVLEHFENLLNFQSAEYVQGTA